MVSEINILNAERTAQEGEEEAKKRRELEQEVQQSRLQMATGDAIGALNDLAQAFCIGTMKNKQRKPLK